MGSSCKDLRNAVAICLQKSPCVMIERNTPKQCVENSELRNELPEECRIQLLNFFECKRGMVDMRKRFRGNGPISTGKHDEKLSKMSRGEFDMEEERKFLAGLSHKEESK
uniref:ARAD1C35860p n=1 Tax=Blastobotrys adeninivorans TaxID=409370 RepID=A0A060T3B2_BLAAD